MQYKNKIPIYSIIYLLKGDYRFQASEFTFPGVGPTVDERPASTTVPLQEVHGVYLSFMF